MKRSALIHPFLFTLTSVLFTYIATSNVIAPSEAVRPLLGMWLLLLLLIFPLYKTTKSWDSTGIFLTLFVFIFYFVKIFFLVFFIITSAIIIIWGGYLKIRKRKVPIKSITLILNLLSIVFVIVGGVKLGNLLSTIPSSYLRKIQEETPLTSAVSRQSNPNIYYIVLDGYPRSDILKNMFEYDNSDFINYLQSRDFIIPSNIHSNYHKTFLSIASTLNMDYIQNITPGLEANHFWWLMSPLIKNSQTRMILKDIGYTTVSLSVDWTITNDKTTDIYYQPSSIQISEFETYFLYNTSLKMFMPLLDKVAYLPMSQEGHREMVLFNFETLSELGELPEPYFLFTHIISPHPPFVFDKNGNPISPNKDFSFSDGESFISQANNSRSQKERNEAYREGLIQQVQFVNNQLIQVVDSILKNSKNPPIIILLADHGSGLATNFSSSEDTCVYERFSPFAAYYLPEIDKTIIPDDMSSVNLFRIIFNEYFETEYSLLENHYYFSENLHDVYKLEEILSQRINTPCQIQP